MSLLTRSLSSIRWNTFGGISKNIIILVQTIILARLLPVDVFGAYGLALAIVRVSVRVSSFGMDGAFIHRTRETEDIEQASSVYFSLLSLFTLAWAIVLFIGTFLFSKGDVQITLFWLIVIIGLQQLSSSPRLILRRKVAHKRLAIIDFLDAVLSAIISVFLAAQNLYLLSLISINIVTLGVSFIGLLLWHPVWKIKFSWENALVKYYISFGYKSFLSGILYELIDRIDDIWVGFFLNNYSLGIYSRAFSFATYPRKLIADPINRVALGYYAELKNKPKQLAQAFFYSNGVIIRVGFLFAGLLALVAPEFIVILLGEKWLPMLSVFRLMLLFTLLSPLEITTSHLFVGIGVPSEMVKARTVQVISLTIGLFSLGFILGIEGVALTIGLTSLIGISFMFIKARKYISFSIKKLFLFPALSFIFSIFMTLGVLHTFHINTIDIISGIIKAGSFTVTYLILILLSDKDFFLGAYHLYKSQNSVLD